MCHSVKVKLQFFTEQLDLKVQNHGLPLDLQNVKSIKSKYVKVKVKVCIIKNNRKFVIKSVLHTTELKKV